MQNSEVNMKIVIAVYPTILKINVIKARSKKAVIQALDKFTDDRTKYWPVYTYDTKTNEIEQIWPKSSEAPLSN